MGDHAHTRADECPICICGPLIRDWQARPAAEIPGIEVDPFRWALSLRLARKEADPDASR